MFNFYANNLNITQDKLYRLTISRQSIYRLFGLLKP